MSTPVRTKTLKQTITFPAVPEKVFGLLMDSKRHTAFTGAAAFIEPEVGGHFSAYDGYIEGKTLELDRDRKIVQSWRGRDWPVGHYSTVMFLFTKVAGGSRLRFTHKGIPLAEFEGIKEGWKDFYWKRMKEYLKKD